MRKSSDTNIENCILRYVTWLSSNQNYTVSTVTSYRTDLIQFVQFLQSNFSGKRIFVNAVDGNMVLDFLDRLRSEGVQNSTLSRKMTSIRSFFRFLCFEKVIISNPVGSMSNPIVAIRSNPKLAIEKIEQALEVVEDSTFIGARDRAIIEVFYGGGVRLGELVELHTYMLDLNEGLIRFGRGKNGERIVYIGRLAVKALLLYLESRDQLLDTLGAQRANSGALFLTVRGRPLGRRMVQKIVQTRLERVIDIASLSPQLLRRSFSDHLIDAGADIASVKQMLGHVSILSNNTNSTKIDIEKLRNVYDQAHPRSK